MNEPMSFQEFREQVPIRTQGGSCAVTPVVHMFQGKWKLEILYGLCVKSPLRQRCPFALGSCGRCWGVSPIPP